ncbi:aspartate dehydrogenase [Candidatus Desantisbacteria bacterium]|nr:aspartate dehydrogenase [Candidatus Desantisbacteria bacterium]
MKKILVGIIGCGTIGQEIGKAIAYSIPEMQVKAVSEINVKNLAVFNKKTGKKYRSILISELISKVDFVIEAASSKISYGIAYETLKQGKDVMILSVGGLYKDFPALVKLAKKKDGRLYIPSGAIGGLDGLRAASLGKIYSVELTTRKPPQSFEGVSFLQENNIDIENIKKELCIFDGNAKEAVVAFPKNINVALTLSLSGIGIKKTKVKIIADPLCKKNIHEINASGDFGKLYVKNENEQSPDNPKTSFLAILSAISMLKNITSPVIVGN